MPPLVRAKPSAPVTTTPSSDQARWFAEEIRPHEPALRAYLRSRFPDVHDVDDLIQESYLRVLQLHGSQRIACTRAYLFATARNAALSLLRRPKLFVPQPVTEYPALGVVEEGTDVVETVSTNQEVSVLLEAVDALPPRCREIFILRKLQGVPQKEIARRLGLSEQTVQVQIGRGVRKCAEFLKQRGMTGRH